MNLLKRLCETPGVSGHEERIQKIVKEELEKLTSEVRVDRLGNVIALKRAKGVSEGSSPLKVMIAAHMDEIGFLIKFIDKDGFLRFVPIGGFDPRTLIAQRVIVHGRKDVGGVIAPEPTWLLDKEDRKKVLQIKDLFIDVGMRREEVSKIVSIGDVVSLDQDFKELNDKVVTSRNFDDRIGVYVMIEALKRVKDSYVDIYAVGTTQEELGCRGATVASFAVEPDVGIALDGSLASDVPYAREEDKHCLLGEGAGIYIIDNRTVSNKKVVNFLIKLAEEHNIKYQINIGGGTDASVMQRNRTGALVCTLGPPTRYMHSVVQICHREDIESNIELVKVFLENAHKGGFS